MLHISRLVLFVRADLVEDTGSSLSPEVDIGQIEGAYIFGVGLWTSEEVKFHPETGKIITVDTWVRYLQKIGIKLKKMNMALCVYTGTCSKRFTSR
jgi:xanthine dehydrogenase molybdopterin-binding subunit B